MNIIHLKTELILFRAEIIRQETKLVLFFADLIRLKPKPVPFFLQTQMPKKLPLVLLRLGRFFGNRRGYGFA